MIGTQVYITEEQARDIKLLAKRKKKDEVMWELLSEGMKKATQKTQESTGESLLRLAATNLATHIQLMCTTACFESHRLGWHHLWRLLRRGLPVVAHGGGPGRIAHVGPLVFVKAGCVYELLFLDVKGEGAKPGRWFQGAPRNGKPFAAQV